MSKQETYSAATGLSAAAAPAVAAVGAACSPHSFEAAVADADLLLSQVSAAAAATGPPATRAAYGEPTTEILACTGGAQGRTRAGRGTVAAVALENLQQQQQQQQKHFPSPGEDPAGAEKEETRRPQQHQLVAGAQEQQQHQQQGCAAHEDQWQPYAGDKDSADEHRRLRLLLQLQREVHKQQKEAQQQKHQQVQDQVHAAQQHLREMEKVQLNAQQQQHAMQQQLQAAQQQVLPQRTAQQQLLRSDGGGSDDGNREVKRCMWKMELQQLQHEAVLRKQQVRLLKATDICRQWLAFHHPEEEMGAATVGTRSRPTPAAAAGAAGAAGKSTAAADAHVRGGLVVAQEEAAAGTETAARLRNVSAHILLSELLLPLLQEALDLCSTRKSACSDADNSRMAPAAPSPCVPPQACHLPQEPATAATVSPVARKGPPGQKGRSREDTTDFAAATAAAGARSAAAPAAAAEEEEEGEARGGRSGMQRHQRCSKAARQCTVVPPLHLVVGEEFVPQQDKEKQQGPQLRQEQGGLVLQSGGGSQRRRRSSEAEVPSSRSRRSTAGRYSGSSSSRRSSIRRSSSRRSSIRRSSSRRSSSRHSSSRRSNNRRSSRRSSNCTPDSYDSSDSSPARSPVNSTRDARPAAAAGREEHVRNGEDGRLGMSMDSSRSYDSNSSRSQDTSSPSPRLPVRVSAWRGRPAFVPRLKLTGESDEEEEQERTEQTAAAAALPLSPPQPHEQQQQQQYQASHPQKQPFSQQRALLPQQQQQHEVMQKQQEREEACQLQQRDVPWQQQQQKQLIVSREQQQQQQAAEQSGTADTGERGGDRMQQQQHADVRAEDGVTLDERWFEMMRQGQQQPAVRAVIAQQQDSYVAQVKKQHQQQVTATLRQQQENESVVTQQEEEKAQSKEGRQYKEQGGVDAAVKDRALHPAAQQEEDLPQEKEAEQEVGGRDETVAEESPTFRREEIEAAQGGGLLSGKTEGDKQQQQPAQREQQEDAQHECAAPEQTAAAAAERMSGRSCSTDSMPKADPRRSSVDGTRGRLSHEKQRMRTLCREQQVLHQQHEQLDFEAQDARQGGSQQPCTQLQQEVEQQRSPHHRRSLFQRSKQHPQPENWRQGHSWPGQDNFSSSAAEQLKRDASKTFSQRERQSPERLRSNAEVALLPRTRVEATWRLQQQLQQWQQPHAQRQEHLQEAPQLQQAQLVRQQPQGEGCTQLPKGEAAEETATAGEGRAPCSSCLHQHSVSEVEGTSCSSCCCMSMRTSSTRRRSRGADCSRTSHSSRYYRQVRRRSDQQSSCVCCTDDGEPHSSRGMRSGNSSEVGTTPGKSSLPLSAAEAAAPCAVPQSTRAAAARSAAAAAAAADGEDVAAEAAAHAKPVSAAGSVQQQEEPQEAAAREELSAAAACAVADTGCCRPASDRGCWCCTSGSCDSCSGEALFESGGSDGHLSSGEENNRGDFNSSSGNQGSSPLSRSYDSGGSRCPRSHAISSCCSRIHSCNDGREESRCGRMRSDSSEVWCDSCYSATDTRDKISRHVTRNLGGSRRSGSSSVSHWLRQGSSSSCEVLPAEDPTSAAEGTCVEEVQQQQAVRLSNVDEIEQPDIPLWRRIGDSSRGGFAGGQPGLPRFRSSQSQSPAAYSSQTECNSVADRDDALEYFDSLPNGTSCDKPPDSWRGQSAAGCAGEELHARNRGRLVVGSPAAADSHRGQRGTPLLQDQQQSQRQGEDVSAENGEERKKENELQQFFQEQEQRAADDRQRRQQQHEGGLRQQQATKQRGKGQWEQQQNGRLQREDVQQDHRRKQPKEEPQSTYCEQQQVQQKSQAETDRRGAVAGEASCGLLVTPCAASEKLDQGDSGLVAETRQNNAPVFVAAAAAGEPNMRSSLACFAVARREQLSPEEGHQQQQAVQELLIESGVDPALVLENGATYSSRTGSRCLSSCCTSSSRVTAIAEKDTRLGKTAAFLGMHAALTTDSEDCSASSSSCSKCIPLVSDSCGVLRSCTAPGKPAEDEAVVAAAVQNSSIPISRLPTTASTDEGFLAARSTTAGLQEPLSRETRLPLQADGGQNSPLQQEGQQQQQQQQQWYREESQHEQQQQQQRPLQGGQLQQQQEALCVVGRQEEAFGLSRTEPSPSVLGDASEQQERLSQTPSEQQLRVHFLRKKAAVRTRAENDTTDAYYAAAKGVDGFESAGASASTDETAVPPEQATETLDSFGGTAVAATNRGSQADAAAGARAAAAAERRQLVCGGVAWEAAVAVAASGEAEEQESEGRLLRAADNAADTAADAVGGGAAIRWTDGLAKRRASAEKEKRLRASSFGSSALSNDLEVEGRAGMAPAGDSRLPCCAASSFAAEAAAAGGVSSGSSEQRTSSELTEKKMNDTTAAGVTRSSLLWRTNDTEPPSAARLRDSEKNYSRSRQTVRMSRTRASSPLADYRDMQLQTQEPRGQYQQQQQVLHERRPDDCFAVEQCKKERRCSYLQHQRQKEEVDRRCLRAAETAATQDSPKEGKIASMHVFSRAALAEETEQPFFSTGLSMVSSSGFSPAAAPQAAARQQQHGSGRSVGAAEDPSSDDEEQSRVRSCRRPCCEEGKKLVSDCETDKRNERLMRKDFGQAGITQTSAAGGCAAAPAAPAAAADFQLVERRWFPRMGHHPRESQELSFVPTRAGEPTAGTTVVSSVEAVRSSCCVEYLRQVSEERPSSRSVQVEWAATRAGVPRTSRSLSPCRRHLWASSSAPAPRARKAGAPAGKVAPEAARCRHSKDAPLDVNATFTHCSTVPHYIHSFVADDCCCCSRGCRGAACSTASAAAQLAVQPAVAAGCSADRQCEHLLPQQAGVAAHTKGQQQSCERHCGCQLSNQRHQYYDCSSSSSSSARPFVLRALVHCAVSSECGRRKSTSSDGAPVFQQMLRPGRRFAAPRASANMWTLQ